jgi:hypothetical protein
MVNGLQQYFKDLEKNQTLIQMVSLGLLAGAVLFLCGSDAQGDLKVYYTYALQVAQGQLPYRDFLVEYPPLALLPILIPQGLNFITTNSFEGYKFFFYVQNILLVWAIGKLVLKISTIQQLPKTNVQIILAYGLLVATNSPFVLYRFDVFCAWLTVWATWLMLTDRPLFSGAVLGLGIAAKLYPGLLVPIFAIYCLSQKKPTRAIQLGVGCAIVLLLLILLLSPLGVNNLFSFLTYHQLRGLQAETLASGLLILANKLGWVSLEMLDNYGALHLDSPAAKVVLQVLPFVVVLGLLGTLSSYLNRIKNQLSAHRSLSSRQLTIYVLAILMVFIAANKVFSPQYLIWLLPFVSLLPTRQIGLFSVISILSFLIYPVFYGFLVDKTIPLIFMLNCRNYLFVVLAIRLFKRTPPRPSLAAAKLKAS